MALQEVPVPVPFQGGVDTKTDPKAVPSAKLLVLQNGTFDRGTTIRKRNGYAGLAKAVTASGMDYSDAKALAARGTEPVLFTDSAAYSYQESLSTWNEIGPVASVSASDESVAHTGSNQTTPDAATSSGVVLLAWEDSRGGVWWTLVEAVGGRVLRAPAQMDADGQRPRCLAVGAVLHLVYATATGELRIAVVNPVEPLATVTSVALTTDLSTTNPSFDAVPTTLGDSAPALIAWANASGGYRLGYVHPSGVLGSPVTGLDSVVDNTTESATLGPIIAHDGDTKVLVVTYDSAAQTTYVAFHAADDGLLLSADQAIAESVVIDRLAAAFPRSDADSALVFREVTAATERDHLVRVWSVDASTANETSITTLRGCGIASRAFSDSGIVHVWLAHDVTFFATYLCMRVATDGTATCVSRSLPAVAYGLPPRAHLPSVETDPDDDRVHRWCATWNQQLESGGTSAVFSESGIRRVALDFDSATAWQTAQLGKSLYLAGACPMRYDGDTLTEAGWHYAPDDIATPTQGTTGALTALGTYLYVAMYEEIDAQGEIHRGPTSVGTTVTLTGSNDSVTLALPTYRITGRRRVRIGVFRSLNGDDSQLFRVTSLDPSAAGANGYVANDTTVDTISFTDEMSDAVLREQEPLYTNGGIPSNDPSGFGSVIAAGKNRLFYSDPSNPLLVRYTQELAEGYAAEFADELGLTVDPYGGAVTALAIMDDRLIVFKKTAIFAASGPGPLRDPSADPSQGFSLAALVTSDVGCTAPSSIAVTPAGIVFQSAKGIYLLGRDMSVSYVGAPVESFNAQLVTRSTLIEDRTQIVFLCSTGSTLLYDYLFGQWSTYTNHAGLDAAVIDGTYHYLRTDGRVFRETPGQYRDDNSQIRMVLETAWIRLHPYLQGMSRFYHAHIIGERKSAHTIRFRYRTDYMAGWSAPISQDWTSESGDVYGDGPYGDGPYGGDAPDVYQWKVHLGEVGQSIRFRFEDVEPTGEFGASYEINELLLTAGVKRVANRPFAAGRTA
jgi:hypothetical protein